MNALPPLPADLFEALKADIARSGVVLPVIVDAVSGEVVDGHHRLRACEELGLDRPAEIKRSFGSEVEREEFALKLDFLRRQSGSISFAQAYLRYCELHGVRLGQGGDRRSTARSAVGRADQIALELGVKPRTARAHVALARQLEPHPDLSLAVDTGQLSVEKARAEAKQRALDVKRVAAARAGRRAKPPASVEVRVGDFAKLMSELEDASVDQIYTDPPYLLKLDLEHIYGELARQAARVLRPGASLIAYVGGYALPRALPALEEHLTYWWPIAIEHAGGRHNTLAGKKVRVKWKLALWFVKGRHAGDRVVDDLVGRSAPDKTLHDWAQSTEEASYYIERLCAPGGLVLDPFCGSGTTLAAALSCGRRGLGFELDAQAANRARYRLAQEQANAA